LNRLGEALGNENTEDLFTLYQTHWDEAMERNENPLTFGVASTLYDALELPYSKGFDGREFQSPRLLMVLSEIIISVIGFTKFAMENYNVKVE